MFPRNAVTDRKICIAEAKISCSCRFRFNSAEQKRFVAGFSFSPSVRFVDAIVFASKHSVQFVDGAVGTVGKKAVL